jgi:DNA topoisomerase-6 subunit A
MAIPKAKFIGFSSADPDRYGLPRNVGIKLNDKDINRAKELMKYKWFQKKEWQNEIKGMLSVGLKYRARCPGQQRLSVSDQELLAEKTQGPGLARLTKRSTCLTNSTGLC